MSTKQGCIVLAILAVILAGSLLYNHSLMKMYEGPKKQVGSSGSIVDVGKTGVIGTGYPCSTSKASLHEAIKLAVANDETGLALMFLNGDIILLEHELNCRVIDATWNGLAQVRIESTEYFGIVLWTVWENIRHGSVVDIKRKDSTSIVDSVNRQSSPAQTLLPQESLSALESVSPLPSVLPPVSPSESPSVSPSFSPSKSPSAFTYKSPSFSPSVLPSVPPLHAGGFVKTTATMPDLVGKTSFGELELVLEYNVIRKEKDSDRPFYEVLYTIPSAGTILANGQDILIVYSNESIHRYTMPNLLGMCPEQAEKKCSGLFFSYLDQDSGHAIYDYPIYDYYITYQSIPAGTYIEIRNDTPFDSKRVTVGLRLRQQ